MARKRKATETTEPKVGSIFEYLGLPETNPGEPASPKPAATEDKTAELLARIKSLEDERSAQNQQIARLSAAPTYLAPAPEPQGIDPKMLQVNLDGLPDPGVDPAEHGRQLALRVNSVMAAREHVLRQEMAQGQEAQSTADFLWTAFVGAHPEWEGYKDLVSSVSTQVLQEAQMRGIDAKRYVLGTTEQFLTDVASRLTKNYGKLIEGDDEEGEDETVPTPTEIAKGLPHRSADHLNDPGRTAGIMGGLESGGKPTNGKPPAGDMFTDLQAVQKRLGIY